MVERFHRHLKAALRASENPRWSEALPLVMLEVRAALKNDLNASPAELVYGRCLRLPGELVAPLKPTDFEYGDFVERLKHHMRQLKPAQTRERVVRVHQPAELSTCPYLITVQQSLRFRDISRAALVCYLARC
ncbi:unnamed protein product [Echinostoma caproni]|uniref:Integrase catalytic domain-containing protein n=1 Tax=Echinostoma caproni TaxID=27848 RepID=A0A183BDC8_9TREM|nr:unnamed protein product [Echinostoma caproni]